jgi:hypothetical protein
MTVQEPRKRYTSAAARIYTRRRHAIRRPVNSTVKIFAEYKTKTVRVLKADAAANPDGAAAGSARLPRNELGIHEHIEKSEKSEKSGKRSG